MKRIAVPSDDGVSIAGHFGRSACFIVFDVEDGRVFKTEVRPNSQTAFARGECSGSEHHEHGQGHSHAGILGLLHDCGFVLCRGMGWRAAEDLKRNGIEPLLVDGISSAQETVEAYLAGKLSVCSTPFCRCHS